MSGFSKSKVVFSVGMRRKKTLSVWVYIWSMAWELLVGVKIFDGGRNKVSFYAAIIEVKCNIFTFQKKNKN